MKAVNAKKQSLFEKAAEFGGFFSSQDAIDAGYVSNNHSYNVKNGAWERWSRGVFRIPGFPLPKHPDFYAAAIYLRGRDNKEQGVMSLDTAAQIHELGDFMPSKIFVTVLPSFDRKVVPENLTIIRTKSALSEYEFIEGLPVAKPLKIFKDFIDSGSRDLGAVEAAYKDARKKGLITGTALRRLFESNSAEKYLILKSWENNL